MPEITFNLFAADDLRDGEMKEFEVGGKKILLSRVKGSFYATSAKCPHYGVSLAEGILCGDRVVCPWHKSVFRVTDGALLEPPSLDGLERYPVSVRDGHVFVGVTEEKFAAAPARTETKDNCFVLAGAGAASTAAAERLRELGFAGRLVLLSPEPEQPYDRTALSKEFLSGNGSEEQLPLRTPAFWKQLDIERITARVTEVNPRSKQLTLSDGAWLSYDKLLLATGSMPNQLKVPGADLGNVFTLRSLKDAQAIWKAAQPGVRTAVVGGSFIGLEVASCFALRKLPVTVIVSDKVPFTKQLGPEVGRILQQWHESHGVEFRVESEVERFEGVGMVQHVVLKSGEQISADLVVVGTGVRPATEFADGLQRNDGGGVIADSRMRAAEDVFVAGDLAVFPDSYSNQTARIEHWRVAKQQGRTAAANMLGGNQAFEGVPYFWTNHFGTRFDYVGHAEQWDEVLLQAGNEPPDFIAFYISSGKVVAAAACQHDNEISALHELMRLRRVPSVEEIRGGIDLVPLLK